MSEEEVAAAAEEIAPRLVLQKVYAKDVSFEVPRGYKSFAGEWKPEIKIDMGLSQTKVNDNGWELDLKLTATVTNDSETAFLVEVVQAGIFLIEGVTEEQRKAVLNTTCATMIFPYAREAIDALVVKGGFPALMLAPINFDGMYQQAMAKRQAEQEAAEGATLN